MRITALISMWTFLIFGVGETLYFGSNLSPKSDAERICDIVAIIGFGCSYLYLLTPRRKSYALDNRTP